MKKRFIALLLCCVMLFTLSPSLIASAAADDDVAPAQTGVTVSPANADLPRNEKVTLTAQAKDAKSFQWQIQAGNTLWVDISGETGRTIQVSYAMVASLLSGNKVALRCKTDAGVSNAVTVTVTAPKVEPQAESQAEPQVEPQVDSPLASQSVMSYALANTALQNDTAADDISGTGETPSTTYNVVINYVFENNEIVADPYTASLAAGSDFGPTTVTFPVVQGYLPYLNEVQQNSIAHIVELVLLMVKHIPLGIGLHSVHQLIGAAGREIGRRLLDHAMAGQKSAKHRQISPNKARCRQTTPLHSLLSHGLSVKHHRQEQQRIGKALKRADRKIDLHNTVGIDHDPTGEEHCG